MLVCFAFTSPTIYDTQNFLQGLIAKEPLKFEEARAGDLELTWYHPLRIHSVSTQYPLSEFHSKQTKDVCVINFTVHCGLLWQRHHSRNTNYYPLQ